MWVWRVDGWPLPLFPLPPPPFFVKSAKGEIKHTEIDIDEGEAEEEQEGEHPPPHPHPHTVVDNQHHTNTQVL